MRNLFSWALPCLLLGLLSVGCSDDEGLDSDEEARRAYLGLDTSIGKSLTLGFQGFNLASSANIDPQSAPGEAGGTLTVSGHVDQGSSANKGMRLYIAMVDYDDGDIIINEDGDTVRIVYNTDPDPANQPYLNLKLNNVPTGTLTGMLNSNASMTGVYRLSGHIEGTLTMNVMLTGTLMAGPNNTVVRVVGTTRVVGTATNADGGVYNIDLLL